MKHYLSKTGDEHWQRAEAVCVGRDCGNVFFEMQLLLDGQFCKPEAIKQGGNQLPRLNCLGRRESVLSTNGIYIYIYI